MNKKSVLVAFSGGLDTSYCVVYLQRVCGLNVHTIFVNTGAFSVTQERETEEKALMLGAISHTNVDVSESYFNDGLKYLLFGNVLRNDTYPLSVSSERVFQAKAIASHAQKIKVDYIAHGSTGAGNDQVRFDLVFHTLVPEIEILTPIRDLKLSRSEETAQLQAWGFDISAETARYSINEGLWGTSIGGGETLTSSEPLPETAWPYAVEKIEPKDVSVTFEKGIPVALNGEGLSPVEVIRLLEQIARPYGIGRDMHTGDTIVGIKGRIGFVAAAPLILIKAHHLLEKHTLTKWQQQLKKQQSEWYGMLFHEGLFLDPVMRDLEAYLEQSQQRVSGTVHIRLFPKRFELPGIESANDLLNSRIAAYGEGTDAWTADDAKGFIRISGIQSWMWHAQNRAQ